LAHILDTFDFIAPKTLKYMAFQAFDFEHRDLIPDTRRAH